MYNVYTTYITAFRLLECKAILSRGSSTFQRPFSENVHLPKVGMLKSVSKSVLQHYSAAASFSKDRQLNRFGQLLPREDATRRPAPISYKLITPNQTRLRKVVSWKAALRWCKATVLYCRGSTVQSAALVLSFRSLSYLLRNFVLSFQATREDVSCSATTETVARMPQRMARNECTVLDSGKRIESGGRKCRSMIYAEKRVFRGEKMHTSAKKIYRLFGITLIFMGTIRKNRPNHFADTLLNAKFDEPTVL